MTRLAVAEAFIERAMAADSVETLRIALMDCCAEMGVAYFALIQHVDFARQSDSAIRLHNYPSIWQDWFDAHGLGRSDPVHRASHRASIGFLWSAVPRIIKLTRGDREVLDAALKVGIGDGFTVPANIPGEILGSCSFAVPAGRSFPEDQRHIAQLVGGFAFEAARRLSQTIDTIRINGPMLTDRQRDCVLWAARGKTDWEIAQILGVSHDTVIEHLRHARERYGVQKRALLAVRALFDGLISFSDVLRR